MANDHLVKRWTNEALDKMVDQALIAALFSQEGDEADGKRAEGCYIRAKCDAVNMPLITT